MGADDDQNAKPDTGTVAQQSSGERSRPHRSDDDAPVDANAYRDYVVKGVEGSGGLGRVLRAHDRRLDRVVALKEMLDPVGDGTDGSSRFLREARLTARLQHPSIVPVYEIGFRSDGAPFYAMKLIAGERFDKVIARCRSLGERLALLPNVIAVTEAVAYAHDHRIIHRDLKPSNVIVGAFGETVVIDWGIAKDLAATVGSMPPSHGVAVAHTPRARSSALEDTLLDLGGDSAARTIAGRTLGTLGYMPPEQYQGEEVDERADVFALGAFLYQTVTGVGPYEGDSEVAMLSRIEKGMPRPVESREPALPLDLATIVHKAMAPRRDERYASAKDLAADLKRFQTGQLVRAHDYSPGLLVARWVSRHTRAVVTVTVFSAVLAALGVVSVRRIVRERDRAESERARAQVEQERAEARTQEVTLVQARTSLDRDPTASIAWLKTARFDDASRDEMASIAADARARGVARVILHAKGIGEVTSPVMSADGRRVFVAPEGAGAVEWDLADHNRVHMHADLATLDEMERPTADGTRSYSGSREGGILEIDLATGATRVLEGHRGLSVTTNAPSGHAFASCAEDGSVRVWDDGKSRVLGQHEGACRSVGYSPDAASLVSAGDDGTLRFFTIATGAARVVRPRGVHEAAWSPDGKTILTSGDDGLGAFDIASGAQRALPTSAGALYFRFIPHANAIAFGGIDASLHLVDLDHLTDRVLHGHTAAIQHLDVARDGQRVLTCADDDTSRLWDLRTGASRALLGHAAVHNCRFSIDEREVLTSGNDGKVRLWDLPQHETRVFLGHEHDVYGLAFSPDGSRIASASYDTTVRVWDVATGKQTILHGHTGPARNVLFLDRTHVASASSDGTVRVWNLDDGSSVVLPHGMHVRRMVATKDGKTLVTDCQDGIARVWDVARGVALQLVGHKGPVIGVALSPDETRIATSSDDHTVRVWDRATGASQLVLEQPGESITGVAFAKGGALVAASSADGTARLWDAKTGALVRVLAGHADRIESLSVSPDGESVATASDDRTVRLWDVETGASKVLVGHTAAVIATVFSPDGRWIASTSYDATTRLWDVRTGKLLTLGRSDAPVQCAAFAPDGSWLAAAGFDRAVRLMPVEEGEFVPAEGGAFRAWVGGLTTAVVMGANEIGSEVGEGRK